MVVGRPVLEATGVENEGEGGRGGGGQEERQMMSATKSKGKGSGLVSLVGSQRPLVGNTFQATCFPFQRWVQGSTHRTCTVLVSRVLHGKLPLRWRECPCTAAYWPSLLPNMLPLWHEGALLQGMCL